MANGNFSDMDFYNLLDTHKPLLRKHWLPLILGTFGLIFFSYGLISLLGGPKSPSEDIVFEAGNDSLASQKASDSVAALKNVSIDIEGAVISPGVYTLALGARVKDALAAALGLSGDADRNWVAKNLNLATKLTDGQKIYIPKMNEAKVNFQETLGVSDNQKININTASSAELDGLPGVGPATASKIIKLRPYSDTNELVSKKAVGSKAFEQIKDKIAAY